VVDSHLVVSRFTISGDSARSVKTGVKFCRHAASKNT